MSYAEERVSEAWSSNHAHLTNLAFGILGDLGAVSYTHLDVYKRQTLHCGGGTSRPILGALLFWLLLLHQDDH